MIRSRLARAEGDEARAAGDGGNSNPPWFELGEEESPRGASFWSLLRRSVAGSYYPQVRAVLVVAEVVGDNYISSFLRRSTDSDGWRGGGLK